MLSIEGGVDGGAAFDAESVRDYADNEGMGVEPGAEGICP